MGDFMPYMMSKQLKFFINEKEVIVYNKKTKCSYSLGHKEYEILLECDGIKPIYDIAYEFGISEPSLNILLELFKNNHLLDGYDDVVGKHSLLFKKYGLVYSENWIRPFKRKGMKSICEFFLWSSFLFALFMLAYMNGKIEVRNIINNITFLDIIILNVMLAVSLFLHEAAHAISAVINGACFGEIGVKFDLVTPIAYTSICGISAVKSRYRKVKIYFSGVSVNAFIAGISLLIMNSLSAFNSKYLFMLFGVNLCLVLLNCLIFMDTDVYKVICVILDEENLKYNTIMFLKQHRLQNIRVKYVVFGLIGYCLEPALFVCLIAIALHKIFGG